MVWIPKEPKYKPKPPNTRKTNTSTDLISRQDALKPFCIAPDGTLIPEVDCDNFPTEFSVTFIKKHLLSLPSADRPTGGMIHIDEVYRLIAGHSNYHGDSILSAFTCLVEGKDVKPIAPLDESADRPTGKWILDPNGMDWNIPAWRCSECGFVANYIGVEPNGLGGSPLIWAGSKFCPQCGVRITGYER